MADRDARATQESQVFQQCDAMLQAGWTIGEALHEAAINLGLRLLLFLLSCIAPLLTPIYAKILLPTVPLSGSTSYLPASLGYPLRCDPGIR